MIKARDFYKKGDSYYYADNNQKILNVDELQTAANAGGKEISQPIIIEGTNNTGYDWENNPNFSDAQKEVLKQLEQGDHMGEEVLSPEKMTEIIKAVATKAEIDLSPYYEKMTNREVDELKKSFEDIRMASEAYVNKEKIDYAQKLKDTKASLRATGRTFGGRGRALLGSEGVIGGKGVKGSLQTEREMLAAEKERGYQNFGYTAGLKAEQSLGTDYLTSLGLNRQFSTPYGASSSYTPGIRYESGDLMAQKAAEIEKAKQSAAAKYRLNS